MHPTTFWYSRFLAATTMLFGMSVTSSVNAASISEIHVESFHEGLASVCVNFSLCAYIDKTGKIVIPQRGESFSEGLAVVRMDNGKGVIDKTGKMVISPQFQFQHISNFSEGLAGAEIKNGTGWGGGFIDKTGKVVIGPQLPRFWAARKFSEGLGLIFSDGGGGFVDKTGKMVIAFQFESANDFSEGLAAVKVNGKWGYIDKTGRVVISPQFENLYGNNFSEGLASVKVNGKWGYIDKAGNMVISPQFENEHGYFSEGLAPVKVNGKWGVIDKTGKMVIAPQFEHVANFRKSSLAYIEKRVQDEHIYRAYIDKSGAIVTPMFYFGEEFSEDLAAVQINKEEGSGYINSQGEWVISPETLKKSMEKYVTLAFAAFRKTLNEGAETNCGPAIEVKAKLVKVAFAVANYGNEHWIRRDEIFPSGYSCRFVNGQYQPPL